ncbi:MAG: nucleoside triphosphate pyrophosphohydrolase [Candidatus Thorarchaeota archaeon]
MVNEKLVRDNIPDIIRADGHEPIIRIAKKTELDSLIRAKIVEEAFELLESGSIEEIADILEAIEALLSYRGIDRESVVKLQTAKRIQRGGFSKAYVLRTDTSEEK